ncbi:MAG: protein kinase, partial [Candidatus Latescibacterota bacterium]
SGGVKIADFGLARAVDSLKSVTQHGKVIGTPAYMSPEQTRGETVDTQTDIFSLGVVAYELACGRRPFDGLNYAEVVSNIQSVEPQPIADSNPLVGANFADIIGRMLQKDLNQRYPHVAEVVLDLEEAIDAAGFKRDRRTLGRYLEDPAGYLEAFNRDQLDRLRANPPAPAEGPEAEIRYHQCVIQLDPGDEVSRAALARMNAKEPTQEREIAGKKKTPDAGDKKSVKYDPDADYKVYLDSIDLSQETAATFALKLSMRIRSPLPRVMAVVNNMPAEVGGRLSIKKAKKLAKVIDQLGGIARIETHSVDESTGSHAVRGGSKASTGDPVNETDPRSGGKKKNVGGYEAAPDDFEVIPPDPDLEKTVEHHPIDEQREDARTPRPVQSGETRKCPKCGWQEDADAKFCSICLFNFNKTEQLSLEDLQARQAAQNPLVVERSRGGAPAPGLVDKIRELPNNIKYGGLAALIILLLLIVFGR